MIAWDAPGYGGSSDLQPTDQPLEAYTAQLHRFLDALRLDSVFLLGHSLGALIAAHAAASRPSRIAKLILADAAIGGEREPRDIRDQKLRERLDALNNHTPLEIARSRGPRLVARDAGPEVIAEVVSIMSEIRPVGYAAAARALAQGDAPAALASAPFTSLLIWGAEDRITPIHNAEQLRNALPGSELKIIYGAGHMPHIEKPEAFNDAVRAFCLK